MFQPLMRAILQPESGKINKGQTNIHVTLVSGLFALNMHFLIYASLFSV
jgi:hypothetical protein